MTEVDDMIAFAQGSVDELAVPDLEARPRRGVAVLTCMDARIDVHLLLGLARGEAHIVRNAGGLVTEDAIRSLAISQRLLGTREVVLVMHEGCGLRGASEDAFAAALVADGLLPSWRLGAFEDLETTVRVGLARLRSSPELVARDAIRGCVFDPATGTLRDVEADGA